MSRTTRLVAVVGLAALFSTGAGVAVAAPSVGAGVIGWDAPPSRVVAGAPVIGWDSATAGAPVVGGVASFKVAGSPVIGWDSAAAGANVIGWD